MTELSLLIDLVLNFKLPQAAKHLIVERIREIEARTQPLNAYQASLPVDRTPRPPRTAQSPSTQRILDEMAAEGASLMPLNPVAPESPGPVVQVAQSPQAMAALAARQEAINIAISGREEKGRTSPRKF